MTVIITKPRKAALPPRPFSFPHPTRGRCERTHRKAHASWSRIQVICEIGLGSPRSHKRHSARAFGHQERSTAAPGHQIPHPHPQNTARGWNRRAASGPLRGDTKAQIKQVESTSYRVVHCLSWLRFLHVLWGLFVCFKEARGEIKFLLHSWSKKGCMYWNQNVSAALSEMVLPAASSTSSWIPHR